MPMLAPAITLRQYHAPAAAPSGWYSDALGGWEAKAAANYATSLLDLSGNGNDLTEGNGAITWTADDGWKFVAADAKHLYALGVPFPTGDYTMIIQYAAVGNSGILCGINHSANFVMNIEPNKFGNRVRYNFGSTTDVVPQFIAGNLAIAGTDVYRDGTDEGNITKHTGSSTGPVGIGANTRGGVSADSFVTANIYAFGMWGSILDATAVAAKATAMAAI